MKRIDEIDEINEMNRLNRWNQRNRMPNRIPFYWEKILARDSAERADAGACARVPGAKAAAAAAAWPPPPSKTRPHRSGRASDRTTDRHCSNVHWTCWSTFLRRWAQCGNKDPWAERRQKRPVRCRRKVPPWTSGCCCPCRSPNCCWIAAGTRCVRSASGDCWPRPRAAEPLPAAWPSSHALLLRSNTDSSKSNQINEFQHIKSIIKVLVHQQRVWHTFVIRLSLFIKY